MNRTLHAMLHYGWIEAEEENGHSPHPFVMDHISCSWRGYDDYTRFIEACATKTNTEFVFTGEQHDQFIQR